MKTIFSKVQLQNPRTREAADIMHTCVHLGFCTNTCPTYVLSRDENESPRGRIELIKNMLKKGGAPDSKTVKHLDSCLSCLSCMTTCAVKVDYVHLIDNAREYIEEHYRRPLHERIQRWLLESTIPHPRIFGMVIKLGRLGKFLSPLAPARYRPLLEIIPRKTRAAILAPMSYPAQGKRRKRVALLAGCAQQVLNSNINAATIRVLQRHGCEVVVVPGAGCCGSLSLHMGRTASAKAMASANIRAWTAERDAAGLDAIVVNASGCGTTVKDYGHLFAHDEVKRDSAMGIAAITRDVTEILTELGLAENSGLPAYKTAYHDPCSMQHGQKLTRQPRNLLRSTGLTVVDVPENHFCCGSAGTYNLLHPHTARQLGQRKSEHIASTGADLLVTGNIGCMIQMQQFCSIPILHTIEMLDWATGGLMPPALTDTPLPEPQRAQNGPAAGGSGSSDIAAPPNHGDGFW